MTDHPWLRARTLKRLNGDEVVLLGDAIEYASRTDPASTEGLREAAQRVIDTFPVGRGDHLAALDDLRAALRDTGPRPDSGIDEHVLRQMVERPMTSAYFEDFNAGRLDSEQVARALAGDYARLSTPRTETSDE